jgi:hypothetical protein
MGTVDKDLAFDEGIGHGSGAWISIYRHYFLEYFYHFENTLVRNYAWMALPHLRCSTQFALVYYSTVFIRAVIVEERII